MSRCYLRSFALNATVVLAVVRRASRAYLWLLNHAIVCRPEPQHDDKSEVVRATAQQGGESKPIEKDAAPCSDTVGGVSKSCSPCKPTFAIETEAERATFGVMIAVSNAVVVGSAASSS